MSAGPAWEEGARALKPFSGFLNVGLHLTLTYLPPLVKELGERHPTERRLLMQSWGRRLDKGLIEKEIHAQFKKFADVWGAPPDFIDGHQHVHVLPVIRDIVLQCREIYAPGAWMRNIADVTALTDNCKYGILAVMGRRWLKLLQQRNIPHNKYLRGTYDYAAPADYAALMARWCAPKYPHPALIYCHPGFPDADLAKFDSVLAPRQREYDFLDSDVFGEWLGWNVKLAGHP